MSHPTLQGKARPQMSLEWYKEKSKSDDDDARYRKPPVFVGEVRSVLRARKLQVGSPFVVHFIIRQSVAI